MRSHPNVPDTLRNRQIILAGGAGGIGRVSAESLAAEGARLVVSYRSNRKAAESLQPIASLVEADLTSRADRSRLLNAAPELYGLVVFAGEPARVKDPAEMEEAMIRSFAINATGPLLLAREAAMRMNSQRTEGAIVLFSTMQAATLFAGSTAYAAAKAALAHGARILAKELRGRANIRVNVVSPGVTAAGMAEASIASGKYNRFLDDGIIHRFGRAEDVTRAVRFFLEPDSYVTGQVLTVDGGLTL